MNNFCNIEKWTVSDLIDAYSEKPNKNKKIKIYKRQRNIVWTDDQKMRLINSLKKGFPIGALLLFKYKEYENSSNITTYLVVDGLQRSSTLVDYKQNPNVYVDKSILDGSDKIEAIVNSIEQNSPGIVDEEKIKDMICDYIKSISGFEEIDGFSASKASKHILSDLKIKDSDLKDDIEDSLVYILKDIKDDSNINSAEIPIIIYNGDVGNLPDIFYNMNKEGTQLSKYEVYSSLWSKPEYLIKINNTEIIDYIKMRYTDIQSTGLEIQDFDESDQDFNTQEFSVFEYIFGLGKYISNEYNIFKISDNSDVDSIIFNLCTLCLLGDISKMKALPDEICRIDRDKFETALIDSIKIVTTILRPIIELNLNRKKKSPKSDVYVYHKDFQIVSIIASIFKEKYDSNLDVKPSWKDDNIMVKNIEQYYLYDILRNYFSSSGDSKAKKCIDSQRYKNIITKKEWDLVIDSWFNDQMSRKEMKRTKIREVDILFLKYLYCKILTSHDETSMQEFEIEHIISVDNLKSKATELNKGMPISCIANLGLLKKEINNEKKEKDIYEYVDEMVKSSRYTQIQADKLIKDCEEKLIMKKSIMDKFKANRDTDYEKAYTEFLKERFNLIKKLFYDKYDIN